MIGYIILVLFLTAFFWVLGLPWISINKIENRMATILYSYVMGFFSFLALFELLFFVAAIARIPFNVISNCLIVVMLTLVIIAAFYAKRKKILSNIRCKKVDNWTRYEIFYLLLFLSLLIYQIYYAFFYSRTYMADDGYAAFSSSTYADNYIYQTYIHTGDYNKHGAEWLQRVIPSFNFLSAFLSYISGVNVSIISHTVLYTWIVVISYIVYFLMADQIFDKTDNKIIFVLFVSVLFIWGYHSHYSLSFRLLGPNDSGKAFLAVVLSPFMMTIMYRVIFEGYRLFNCIQIMILSICACALTLGGIYTFAALLVGMTFFSVIKSKSFKPFLYFLWGGSVPLAFALLYLMYR